MTARGRFLARTALLIAVFFGLDKVVALLRIVIIARVFGVSALLDAFNAANNIPDLLFVLISGGSLAMAFIPVLSEYFSQHGRAEGWRLFSHVANLAFVITAALSAVVAFFALPLVQSRFGIAPGFEPTQQRLVAELMRLNLIATLLFSISGLVIGGLQANQHFLLPALAPVMYNLGQIFGALVLAPDHFPFSRLPIPTFGLGVHGLVYGVIIGACLHLGVQLPALFRCGFRWTAGISVRHTGVLRVLALMGPRIVGMGAFQASELIRDNLASRLGEGAVTALTYGWFIMQVPETIIATAIGTALLPTLARLAARDDRVELSRTLTGALRIMVVLTLPAALGGVFLTRPALQLVFEGGYFTADGTEMVTFAAQMFLVGLMGHSLLELAARTFYAWGDAVTPTVAAVLAMALQVGVSLVLLRNTGLGFGALALATTFAFSAQAIGLLVVLYWRRRAFNIAAVLRGWAAAALAAGCMAVILAISFRLAGGLPGAAAGAMLALAVYGLVVRVAAKERFSIPSA